MEQLQPGSPGTLKGKARLIATLVVLLGTIMDILDTTLINVALPTMQHGLHASYNLLQWVIVGYTLTFAVVLITGGRLGDIFGYRTLFLVGITIFGLGSIACGLAPSIGLLIAFRVLQGAGAALMVPQGTSFVQLMYSPNERGKMMGLFGAIGGLAGILGPILGGFLLHANLFGWSWRTLFLINVPISILAIVAGFILLPKGKSPHPLKIDTTGTVLLTAALASLALPLIEGRELHWPLWTFVLLALSVPFFAAFIWYEQRHDERTKSSLIEPALMKLTTFVRGLLLNFIAQMIFSGLLLTFMLVLQQALGLNALGAALANLPMIVGTVIGVAVLAELLRPKIGRYIVTLGGALLAIGLLASAWTLHHFGLSVHAWQFIPSLLTVGLGMGLIAGPLFSITLQDVDKAHAGSASGIVEAVDQLGGMLGVTLIGAVFFGNLSQGFIPAYAWGAIIAAALAAAIMLFSFALPKYVKSEAELDIA